MQLRHVKKEELSIVNSLYENAKLEQFCVWSDEYPTYLDIEEDFKLHNLFVMEFNNKIVGAISIISKNELDEFTEWQCKENTIEIARVVVHHDYHGMGIAKNMVLQLIDICKINNCKAIHLACQCDNLPAVKTYQKINFNFLGKKFIFGHNYYICEYIIDQKKEDNMTLEKRFLNYVAIDTTADDTSSTTPSSTNQFLLADLLVKELKELGIENAYRDEFAYVYAYIEGNKKTDLTIGLLAHMDTSPDASGKDIKYRIIESYDGKDIVINKDLNMILSPNEYPELKSKTNHRLIVTDGTTLLGADDKAGIAVIMDIVQKIKTGNYEYPNIIITFTPDEEIGQGTIKFNYKYYQDHNCHIAYTLDGDQINNINYENFNAASALITINGFSIHPGSAKNKMVNSMLLAMEFNSLLPSHMLPSLTENYEGFNHLTYISGEVSKTTMAYIIRNHNFDQFKEQKEFFVKAIEFMNNKYGANTFELELKDSYYNMKEIVMTNPSVLIAPTKALKRHNIDATFTPIRGGTDGARLTYSNIITPNLGVGCGNFHGPYEYADITDMNKMSDIVLTMLKIFTEE